MLLIEAKTEAWQWEWLLPEMKNCIYRDATAPVETSEHQRRWGWILTGALPDGYLGPLIPD